MRGDEGIEGCSILDEVKGGVGLLLWQSLRDAVLWAHTPPERAAELFRHGRARARAAEIARRGVDRELEAPLATLARLLGSGPLPERRELAAACRSVSQWADGRGHLKTALAYAQGAAVVMPTDAAASYRVGWLARRRAEYDRAETWFRRAIALARRSGDRQSYALAYVGLGNLYIQRGDFAAAREPFLRAYRAARRASLRQVQAMALHDLFTIAAYMGERQLAQSYAREAFRAYGRRTARLAVLAHDVAWFWTLQGHYSRALPVFQAALNCPWSRSDRILATSNLARAAGGVGDRKVFTDMWAESWRLIDEQSSSENVSEAVLHLAYGAAHLGDLERTRLAVEYGTEVARSRKEARVTMELERVWEAVLSSGRLASEIPCDPEVPDVEAVEALAADLVRALQR